MKDLQGPPSDSVPESRADRLDAVEALAQVTAQKVDALEALYHDLTLTQRLLVEAAVRAHGGQGDAPVDGDPRR